MASTVIIYAPYPLSFSLFFSFFFSFFVLKGVGVEMLSVSKIRDWIVLFLMNDTIYICIFLSKIRHLKVLI